MIAAHYVAAFEAAPDAEDASEIRAKARDALTRAGERATAARGIGRGPSLLPPRRRIHRRAARRAATLLDRAGQAALRANDPAAARELLERAQSLFGDVDTQGAALVSAKLAELDFLAIGHSSQAVTRLESALQALAEPSRTPTSRPSQVSSAGFSCSTARDTVGCHTSSRRWSIAERLGRAGGPLPGAQHEGLGRRWQRSPRSGADPARGDSLSLSNTISIRLRFGPTTTSAGRSRLQDLLPESVAVCERAAAHARRIGDRSLEMNFDGGSLYARWLLGDWDEALQPLRSSLPMPPRDTYQLQLLLLQALELLVDRGELAEARARWERLTAGADPDRPPGDHGRSRDGGDAPARRGETA